ncbi:MAG: tRNA pseudouridine(55) synthase TruB [Acidobacteriota bacterium]
MSIPTPADGLILLNKPEGLTSHDCVVRIRKLLPRKFKVGHGGTLDPFCGGLLILLLGKATRLAGLFQAMDKTYEGVIRFGRTTDSYDRDGKVTQEGPLPSVAGDAWGPLASRFVGKQQQVPPMFSAKRVGHKRAYELARKGEVFELDPVEIEIFEFHVKPVSDEDLEFRLRCSSGTYVRALARDLGKVVESPAYCETLRRTAVGPFEVEQANDLESPFDGPGFLPFDDIELGCPLHRVNYTEEKQLLNGQNVMAPLSLHGRGGYIKLVSPKGRFIALGTKDGRQIRPRVVFR